MANIPITQIPNAPQTGPSSAPLPLGAIRTPDVELMPVIESESYMAIGRAYSNLGNAGQQAAGVLADFGLSMARASDEANLAKADSIKTDMVAKFDAEVATKPESEWNSIWENNYAPKLRDQVSSLKMTTRDGLNRRDTWLANTENGIKAQVYTSANKAMIGRAVQEKKNQIERAKVDGRWEDAMVGWRQGAMAGLWTTEYGESQIIGIEQEQKAETKRQLWETVDTQMIQRLAEGTTAEAEEVTADLRQAVESGSFQSKFFPSLNGEPADIKKALKMWEGHSQNSTIDKYNEAVTGIAEGQYGTADELRDEWGDKLDTINMQKLEAAFNQSPEEQSKRLAQRPQLVTAIDLYDPSVDQESKEFDRLLSWVHTMPAGFQADLSQMLRDKKKDAQPKPSTAIEAIKQRSREMFTLGKYGSIKNEEAWQAAKTRQSREIDMLNSWAAANPKEAADATKVTEQYNQIRTKIYQEDMADGTAEMPKPEMLQAPKLNPRRVLQDPRFGNEGRSPLDAVQLPLGDGSWQVTAKTRDQIKSSSRAGQRQVSLDFNSGVSTSRGVEIVIPHDATPEERVAAQAYVDKTVNWYRSKGIEVPAGRVLTKTGRGSSVSRFHTEPFYVQDADAMTAVQNDPDGYAAILEETLGRLSGVTFIAPHKTTDGGAQNDQINERDFARSYLIPALQRRKGGEPTLLAQNE
jgi:hypothetical protein